MIVDAHHHLWKIARGDYFWLDVQRDPAQAVLNRDFGVEEYRALAEQFGIAGSVVVQAAQTEAETHWLLQQAASSEGLNGAVPDVNEDQGMVTVVQALGLKE